MHLPHLNFVPHNYYIIWRHQILCMTSFCYCSCMFILSSQCFSLEMGIINYIAYYCQTARKVIVATMENNCCGAAFNHIQALFWCCREVPVYTASTSTTSNLPECLLSEVYIGKVKESLTAIHSVKIVLLQGKSPQKKSSSLKSFFC